MFQMLFAIVCLPCLTDPADEEERLGAVEFPLEFRMHRGIRESEILEMAMGDEHGDHDVLQGEITSESHSADLIMISESLKMISMAAEHGGMIHFASPRPRLPLSPRQEEIACQSRGPLSRTTPPYLTIVRGLDTPRPTLTLPGLCAASHPPILWCLYKPQCVSQVAFSVSLRDSTLFPSFTPRSAAREEGGERRGQRLALDAWEMPIFNGHYPSCQEPSFPPSLSRHLC